MSDTKATKWICQVCARSAGSSVIQVLTVVVAELNLCIVVLFFEINSSSLKASIQAKPLVSTSIFLLVG